MNLIRSELINKFQQLNAPFNERDESEFVDYNNWVDDILNISPPYHTNANWGKVYNSQMNSQASIIPRRK